jgi:hypothetical protein
MVRPSPSPCSKHAFKYGKMTTRTPRIFSSLVSVVTTNRNTRNTLHPDIQIFRYSDIQIFRYSDIQILKFSQTDLFAKYLKMNPRARRIFVFQLGERHYKTQHTQHDIQIFRYSDVQKFQMFRCSDVQMFRCSDVQISSTTISHHQPSRVIITHHSSTILND